MPLGGDARLGDCGLTLNHRPEEAVCHSVQTRHSTARLSLDPLLDQWLVRPRRAVPCVAAYVIMLRGLDGHRVLPFAARHSSIGGGVCATLIDQRRPFVTWCRRDTQSAFVTLIRCSIGALAMARHSAPRSRPRQLCTSSARGLSLAARLSSIGGRL